MFFKTCRKIFFFFSLAYFLSLYSVPDLTIVGFLEPNGGIGKVPITIIETLGDKVTINFIATSNQNLKEELVSSVKRALENPDLIPGKVAILTDLLWDCARKAAAYVPKESIVKVAYSMLETTRIPNMWVKILNEEFDAVIIPDSFLLKVYESSGVKIPIFVLSMPMMLSPYFEHPIHPEFPSTPFVFGDASANKNPAILVEAFAKAFGNNPNVHLVLRAGQIMDATRNIIEYWVNQYGLTNITIEEGHLCLNQFIDRLSSFDCYVNLSRGEGFSLIPREALALGIPVIIADNTASTTICNSSYVRAVPCHKKGPTYFGYELLFHDKCGEQFDCEVNDAIDALLDVYHHYKDYIEKACKGRDWVSQYHSENEKLKKLYFTLVKPEQVILSHENKIERGILFTDSCKLYEKYQQLINSYQE